MSTHKLSITGIDCANCAANLERHIAKIDGLSNVSINFMGEKLIFDCDDAKYDEMIGKIKAVIDKVEPDAVLGGDNKPRQAKEHHHEHNHEHGEECGCGHDHHHDHGEECGCGHHHHHEHGESCSCGHDHHHEHGEECGCGHDHHHEHGEECGCGHDHHHEHSEECGCGHDHHHEHGEECGCGHHHEHGEECGCGHDHHHDHGEKCGCGHHHHDEPDENAKFVKCKTELTDVDCPNCAEKLKNAISEIDGIYNVSVNHIRERLIFVCESEKAEKLIDEIKKVAEDALPEANVGEILSKEETERPEIHHHEHGESCSCGHDHHHEHGEECGCGHHHEHGESCSCGHEIGRAHV